MANKAEKAAEKYVVRFARFEENGREFCMGDVAEAADFGENFQHCMDMGAIEKVEDAPEQE